MDTRLTKEVVAGALADHGLGWTESLDDDTAPNAKPNDLLRRFPDAESNTKRCFWG